jgi:2-polyprenyl-3-methyl-5-hydroxy-6-metoxy-1,4-benzoquinol methylase
VSLIQRGRAKLRGVREMLKAQPRLEEEVRFLMNETRRLNEQLRAMLAADALDYDDRTQTAESFDYQWRDLNYGAALPGDREFSRVAPELVCTMTGKSAAWFPGKRVVDVGCGTGRFSRALLELGAEVQACDQSGWALERTRQLCKDYGDRLQVRQIDLLAWEEPAAFDLAFCYGVVHHTGNTYLAIRNVARKVADGGSIFLMVYGWPGTLPDLQELNQYEQLRQELRCDSPEQRHRLLEQRFGPQLAHGYFDAVAPRINDLLTFEEAHEVLLRLGFRNVRRTLASRNLHIAADKAAQAAPTPRPR